MARNQTPGGIAVDDRSPLNVRGLLLGLCIVLIGLLAWNRLTVQAAPSAEQPTAPPIDISVAKTDSPDPVLVGNRLTYSVVVHNAKAGARAL